jgi:AAA domain/Primase C terminal 2 (PriCT-2)
LASPLRHISVFKALPRPANIPQGVPTVAAIAVPDAFKVVPAHLKGQKPTDELSRPPLTEVELDAILADIPINGAKFDEWNNTGLEIYAACKGADYGLDVFERWSQTDPAYAAKGTGCADAWKRFHTSPPTRTGAGALINKARAVHAGSVVSPAAPVQNTVALTNVSAGVPAVVTPLVTGSVLSGSDPDWTNVPPREWLYGFDLVRGEVTMVASPGGVGKSALVIGMVMSLAFQKDLLGERVWDKDHKVLYINGEDPRDELRRRTMAFGTLHGISQKDMQGRLFILGNDSWQAQKLNFLRSDGRNSVIAEDSFAFFETLVAAEKFSAVVVDPLVNFVGVGNMNDNALMAQVMRRFKQLAAKYHSPAAWWTIIKRAVTRRAKSQ